MTRLMDLRVANTPLHIIMGSRSDEETARRMVEFLKGKGFTDYVVHILSCHRNPDELWRFASDFKGRAVWLVGGMSFQLPAVLQSWFFYYDKHVPLWGHPVGQQADHIKAARSAMAILPKPFLIHLKPSDSDAHIAQAGKEILDYLAGTSCPEGESCQEWEERLNQFHSRQPEFDISLEEVTR